MLSSTDPTTAIKEVQKRGALAVRVAQRTRCFQSRHAVCTISVHLPLEPFATTFGILCAPEALSVCVLTRASCCAEAQVHAASATLDLRRGCYRCCRGCAGDCLLCK